MSKKKKEIINEEVQEEVVQEHIEKQQKSLKIIKLESMLNDLTQSIIENKFDWMYRIIEIINDYVNKNNLNNILIEDFLHNLPLNECYLYVIRNCHFINNKKEKELQYFIKKFNDNINNDEAYYNLFNNRSLLDNNTLKYLYYGSVKREDYYNSDKLRQMILERGQKIDEY